MIVEYPQAPPSYFQPPSQSFPKRWPSNLVAALVPADWAAENFSFQFGQADEEHDYEYEEYEYEYEEYDYADYDDENNTTDYYGDEYGGNNAEEYPEEYNYDYAEDDADTVSETVPEETPVAVAVPLPLDLIGEGEDEALEEATDA